MDDMIYIPLGNSCSVAYNLQQFGLRNAAYPFDWVRSKHFKKVIQVITSDFKDYEKFQKMKNVISYPILNGDNFNDNGESKTIKARNKYGIISFHDYSSEVSFESQIDVEKKYLRRIQRFRDSINQTDRTVVFIWDEHNPKKLKWHEVKYFTDIIHDINPNLEFTLVIICHNPSNTNLDGLIKKDYDSNVKFILDQESFDDWRRPNIDWSSVFTL